METKVLDNKTIVDAKNNIIAAVDAELKNGVPISVMSMILHGCMMEVNNALNEVLLNEINSEKEKEK